MGAEMRAVLGCGNFGGIGSAPEFFGQGETREQAFALMSAAWAMGLRWFDTADAYGGGRSESWIGDWIQETGKQPQITTKTFNPMEAGADRGLGPRRVLRQAESSLDRLGIDRIDLYLTHEPDPRTPVAKTVSAFEQLVERRLIEAWGVSNVDAAGLRQWLEVGRPALVQNSYSLLDRGDEEELIPLCAEHGIPYQRDEAPPDGSRMTMRPEPYRHLEDERVYAGLGELKRLAADRGVSTAGLALAWALGGADSIVVGPRRPEQLEPVHEALLLELSRAERKQVGSLFG
jgi:aryl-alcohol dehydrogenase-like predicted oxidoreductase